MGTGRRLADVAKFEGILTDCRYFKGFKPCWPHKKFGQRCLGCKHYRPTRTRVLLIKLAAMGDVVRTASLLGPIRAKYGSDCHITWLTSDEGFQILRRIKGIDKLIPYNGKSQVSIMVMKFQAVICLDKEPESTAIAVAVEAEERYGFGMDQYGNTAAMSDSAREAFQLGIDDEAKTLSCLTYQQLCAKMIGVEEPDDYPFFTGFKAKEEIGKVGLNYMAGDRFFKKWKGWEKLAELLKERGYKPEMQEQRRSIMDYVGWVASCSCVVTMDSFGMHLGIALRRRVVTIFGSTPADDIDMYGRGVKLVPDSDCLGCYRKKCFRDTPCYELITPEQVADAVVEIMEGVPCTAE